MERRAPALLGHNSRFRAELELCVPFPQTAPSFHRNANCRQWRGRGPTCHRFESVQRFAMDSASKSPDEVSPLDWYRLFRSRIEHEDNLIIQRLSWLVASQAFLFSAY